MMPILSPAICQGCFRQVVWSRSDKLNNPGGPAWRNPRTLRRHFCAESYRHRTNRCEVRMPTYGDRCGRKIGHQYEHRSRRAMDADNAATERWRARVDARAVA